MNKNTKEEYARWRKGQESAPGNVGTSIWTDGVKMYSYNTLMLELDERGNPWLNTRTYSQTTTRQQNGLIQLLREDYKVVRTFDGPGFTKLDFPVR